jgi:NADH:ubiquinone oxidoreductase subunit E
MSNDTQIGNEKKYEVVLCMGSACFTRGNRLGVEIATEYIRNKGLGAKVELKGCLCSEKCKSAPVMKIDDVTYEKVTPQSITELIEAALGAKNE